MEQKKTVGRPKLSPTCKKEIQKKRLQLEKACWRRVRIRTKTFEIWRSMTKEMSLPDDQFATYLLAMYQEHTTRCLSGQGASSSNRPNKKRKGLLPTTSQGPNRQKADDDDYSYDVASESMPSDEDNSSSAEGIGTGTPYDLQEETYSDGHMSDVESLGSYHDNAAVKPGQPAQGKSTKFGPVTLPADNATIIPGPRASGKSTKFGPVTLPADNATIKQGPRASGKSTKFDPVTLPADNVTVNPGPLVRCKSTKFDPVSLPAFTGPPPGPTTKMYPDDKELEFFHLLFPLQLVQLLVLETNNYAEEWLAVNGKDPMWKPVTLKEMQAFLGLRIAMSVFCLRELSMYWSTDSFFGNLHIGRVLSRERFEGISRYFSAADCSADPLVGQEKFHGVRAVLGMINENCKKQYHPHRSCIVGATNVKTCATQQPATTVAKAGVRADPENGYCNEFQIYSLEDYDDDDVDLSFQNKIVWDLTEQLQHHNYVVTIEGLATSVDLLHTLDRKGVLGRGTMAKSVRKLPGLFSGNHKNACIVQQGRLTAYKWQDGNRDDLLLLSTADDPIDCGQVFEELSRVKWCPPAVDLYLKHKNVFNGMNSLRSEYTTQQNDGQLWLRLFWFAFDIAVANALVLMNESQAHRQSPVKLRSMLHFRQELAKQLIGV